MAQRTSAGQVIHVNWSGFLSMFDFLGAVRVRIRAVACQRLAQLRNPALALIPAAVLAGCVQIAPPLAGPDPADPGVRVRGASYRSTVAPYTSLRPASPVGWKEHNQGVTPPAAKSE